VGYIHDPSSNSRLRQDRTVTVRGLKPGFHYPSWRPELTGGRFPLPVNTGRVDGRAFPLAESTRLVETRIHCIHSVVGNDDDDADGDDGHVVWFHDAVSSNIILHNVTDYTCCECDVSSSFIFSRENLCLTEDGQSIECITYAGHSIAFLHLVTLWPWPFELVFTCGRGIVMDCAKFADCTFSCFGFYKQTELQTPLIALLAVRRRE